MDDLIVGERIEGIDNNIKFIDPKMSRSSFYRKWRPYVEPITMEYPRWWLRDPPTRYLTYRRLLIAIMLDVLKPSRAVNKEKRRA
jgi:hypothetical protein